MYRMNEEQKLQEIENNRNNIPPIDNLPSGYIDWEEISLFILHDMKSQFIGMSWSVLNDESKTRKLSNGALSVLKNLRYDLYEFFYRHDVALDRNGQWRAMEGYIRTKYSGLSEIALSRLISDYHFNDK